MSIINTPKNQIPPSASLVAPRHELGFLHSASAIIDTDASVFQLYCLMTAASPSWLKSAFRIRDSISQHFHVEKIGGFSGVPPQTAPLESEKLDFFSVESISAQKLVLTSRDTHLAVMVSIDAIGVQQRRLHITTSVKTFNTFGRLYMLPVAPIHGVIIKLLLSRLPLYSPTQSLGDSNP